MWFQTDDTGWPLVKVISYSEGKIVFFLKAEW